MDRTTEQVQAGNKAQAAKAAAADTWITVKELQDILGIGHTKAYELVTTPGGIPSIRIGKSIRVNMRELTTWLEQRKYRSGND
jgi:excisionase family DNA binding protein